MNEGMNEWMDGKRIGGNRLHLGSLKRVLK